MLRTRWSNFGRFERRPAGRARGAPWRPRCEPLEVRRLLTITDPNGLFFSMTAGLAAGPVVATFVDSNPSPSLQATVVWGDGRSSSGTVRRVSGTSYEVTGTHAYVEGGVLGTRVDINDLNDGSKASAFGAAIVAGSALSVLARPVAGVVGQPFNNWAAGTYQISFEAAQRANNPGGASREDFEVLLDGDREIGKFTPVGTTYQSYTTSAFTVAAGPHTIEFQGLNTAGGDNTVFLDAITLSQAGQVVPTVVDAGFESPTLANGSFQYNPNDTPWNFTPATSTGGSGISANNSGFTSKQKAPEGVQIAFLQGNGTITQAVTSVRVATITAGTPVETAGNFTATVAWGDGETSSTADGDVTIAPGLAGGFDVYASKPHPFADAGIALAAITVQAASPWSTLGSLPNGLEGLAAATGQDGRIYAIGGLDNDLKQPGSLFAYTPDTDTWAQLANMPGPLAFLAAATGPDGRIYAIGGQTYFRNVVNSVYAYAPGTNTWSQVASLPVPLTDLAATTGPDGRIYTIGGQDSGFNAVGAVFAYSPLTNTWAQMASLPAPRSDLAVTTGPDGRIYAIGGVDANRNLVSTVYAYSPSTNTWSPAASLPTGVGFLSAVTGLDGRIYATSGGTGKPVYVYTPATNTWAQVAGPPVAPFGPAVAIGTNGRIYAMGGTLFTGGSLDEKSRVVVSYTPAFTSAAAVVTIAEAPLKLVARSFAAVQGQPIASVRVASFTDLNPAGTVSDYTVTIAWGDGETSSTSAGNVLITANGAGGFDVRASKPHPYAKPGAFAPVITVINGGSSDYAVNAWTAVAAVPAAGGALAATTGLDGRIFALGGLQPGGKSVSSVYAYTQNIATWAQVADLPVALSNLAAASGPDGRIYAFGGIGPHGNQSTVYIYSPVTATWSTAPPLPAALSDLAATTGPDGSIYALGGLDSGGNPVSTVYAYAPSTNTWRTVASLPVALSDLAATTGPDGRIYVAGGLDSGGNPVSTVYAYAPSTNSWSTVGSMPVALSDLAATTGPDGRIYAVGGYSGVTPVSTAYAYAPGTNTWAQVAGLPSQLFGLAATIGPDSRIYAFGGVNSGPNVVSAVTAYTAMAATDTGTATATIAPAPLNVVAQPIAAVAGRAFTDVVLANVTVNDPGTTPTDLTAKVTWGDGYSSLTTVVADGRGGFEVLGTHTYVAAGAFTFSVQVSDTSGANATATGTATVAAGTLSAGTFAVLRGTIAQGATTAKIPFAISHSDFRGHLGRPKILDFSISSADGSPAQLGASVIVVRGRDLVSLHVRRMADRGIMASLAVGDFDLIAKARPGATVQINVKLLGDVDGNDRVGMSDLKLIRSALGARVGTPNYLPAADVNGDGRINMADLRLARRNLGATMTIRPLFVSLTTSAVPMRTKVRQSGADRTP